MLVGRSVRAGLPGRVSWVARVKLIGSVGSDWPCCSVRSSRSNRSVWVESVGAQGLAPPHSTDLMFLLLYALLYGKSVEQWLFDIAHSLAKSFVGGPYFVSCLFELIFPNFTEVFFW